MYKAQFDEFVFGMKGTSRRAAYVIDKEGIIRHAQVLPTAPESTDFPLIFNKLKEI